MEFITEPSSFTGGRLFGLGCGHLISFLYMCRSTGLKSQNKCTTRQACGIFAQIHPT